MKTYRRALSIGGFDGSGGAGIQADLKTFSALGCYAQTVLTSLPVQNTTGVKAIYDISLSCIEDQIKSIFDDIGVDVVKIGMLHDEEIIKMIGHYLKIYQPKYLVIDPVMVAKSGHRLLKENAIKALMTHLFPLATIITPNIPEASDLLGREIQTDEDMMKAALDLAYLGSQAVIVKGGHRNGPVSSDVLYDRHTEKFEWYESPRITTKNTHGTGCTFSAAITSFLSRDLKISEAVSKAKNYLSGAIVKGENYRVGEGHGPVHHFHEWWD